MGSLRRWAASRVPLVLIPVLVLGCGGSGGGTARGKNPAGAPKATITFPPAGALTDASQVTVTGTATDVDGVFSVSVNGVACTSGDGFATWQAQVPVVVGANTMTVQTVDGIGNTQPNAASVTVTGTTVMAFDPASVVVDAANNRSLVAFQDPPSVLAVDLTTGDRSLISRADLGSGSNLDLVQGLELDGAGGRVLVTNVVQGAANISIIAVDLATGNRTVVSSSTVGTGSNFLFPTGITLDAGATRALVPDLISVVDVALATGNRSTLFTSASLSDVIIGLDIDTANGQLLVVQNGPGDALLGVDLASGVGTIIADATTGSGAAMTGPRSVCLDTTTTPARALVVDLDLDGVLTVNLANGARTVLADASTGSGAALTNPEDIEVDAANNRALVTLDSLEDQVLAVDLASGDRSALTQMPGVGSGTALGGPESLVLDSTNGRLLVLDASLDAVVAVAIPGGNRTIISGAGTGTGTSLVSPTDLVLDSANGRVLVTDIGSGAVDDGLVVAVDLATGNRTEFSGPGRGIGPPNDFDRPEGLVLDSANGRVLVVDSGLDAVVAVDLATGNRSVIADDSTGTGTNLDAPTDLVLDLAGNRVLVVDSGGTVDGVLAVDLTSGNRTVISNDTTGTGGAFETPTDLVLDSVGNRLLVVDSLADQVISVDLANGNRTELSGAAVGDGPLFSVLEGVVRDAASQTLFLVDRGMDTVLAVEEGSGDRVMISR